MGIPIGRIRSDEDLVFIMKFLRYWLSGVEVGECTKQLQGNPKINVFESDTVIIRSRIIAMYLWHVINLNTTGSHYKRRD